MGTNQDTKTDFVKRAAVIVGLAAAAAILLLLLWQLAHVLLVIFAGILLAVFLHGLTVFTGRRLHVPHFISLIIVVVVLAAAANQGMHQLTKRQGQGGAQ